MFGAKYSRLKFWIWSIILLFLQIPIVTFFRIFEQSDSNYTNPLIVLTILTTLINIIWMNALANRIRDYRDNPWLALFSVIPFANIGLALYYGIAKSNIKEVHQKNDSNSLTSAVYNHSKDIINGIKPAINEYKESHTTPKLNNDIKSFTIDEISNHPDRVKIDDFDNTYFTKLKETKFNYLTEDEIYEKIMIEIETDVKVKSTWARALAQSDGDKNKAESIYIKDRVLFIKNEQEIQKKQEIEQKEKEEIQKKQEIEHKLNNYLSDGKLKIIGIGGGASNIVEFIQFASKSNYNCLIMDSDQNYLDSKKVSFKILLTDKIINELNQNNNFKINSLDAFVGNVKSVTIIVTLGSVTGSISSLSIIRYLNFKQININIIATKPFTWEGENRSILANNFLAEVNKYCSNIKVFENEDILNYESEKEGFTMMDKNIFQEIKKYKGNPN